MWAFGRCVQNDLVADKGEIAPEKQARHDELQSARERKNESQRLYKQRKRQKRQEEAAIAAEIKLLVNSDGNKHKLIQLVSDGTIKKVLMLYFVSGQKKKLSDKFLETVDGCKEVSRHLILSCLDSHIPELSTMMKDGISCKKPLSMDNSIRARQIILKLFPE